MFDTNTFGLAVLNSTAIADGTQEIDHVVCNTLEGSNLKSALAQIDSLLEEGCKIKKIEHNTWIAKHGFKNIATLQLQNNVLNVEYLTQAATNFKKVTAHAH